jgi:hypothetical protein
VQVQLLASVLASVSASSSSPLEPSPSGGAGDSADDNPFPAQQVHPALFRRTRATPCRWAHGRIPSTTTTTPSSSSSSRCPTMLSCHEKTMLLLNCPIMADIKPRSWKRGQGGNDTITYTYENVLSFFFFFFVLKYLSDGCINSWICSIGGENWRWALAWSMMAYGWAAVHAHKDSLSIS